MAEGIISDGEINASYVFEKLKEPTEKLSKNKI